MESKTSKPERSVSMSDLGMTVEEVSGQSLDLVAREGARMILEAALNEEVDAFLNRGWYEVPPILWTENSHSLSDKSRLIVRATLSSKPTS